jgi:hypothetical protein
MLNHFCDMDPNIERILDMGFSPPKNSQSLSLEEKRNSYLNSQATNTFRCCEQCSYLCNHAFL